MPSEENLIRWLITSLIALLAGGAGVVALLRYFRPDRAKIETRIWMEETPFYELSNEGGRLIIRSRSDIRPTVEDAAVGKDLYPKLNIDIHNPTDKQVALNELQVRFMELTKRTPLSTEPPVIVIKFHDNVPKINRDELASKYALQLIESDGDFETYRHSGQDSVESVQAQLRAEQDLVERVFLDASGEPHRRWETTQPVDIVLDREHKNYHYAIGHTLRQHDAMTIPISIAVLESMTGHAAVTIIYNATESHDLGELELMLEKLSFLRPVERGSGQREAA